MAFGHDSDQPLNDIWLMNAEQTPFVWVPVNTKSSPPPARLYHSASVCYTGPAASMVVFFGGRNAQSRSLNDVWGLRQHRSGAWDWIEAPVKRGIAPEPRFQHSSIFVGAKLYILGGRTSDQTKSLPLCSYDTELCEWRSYAMTLDRYRHASWQLVPGIVAIWGGFSQGKLGEPVNSFKLLMTGGVRAPVVAGPNTPITFSARESRVSVEPTSSGVIRGTIPDALAQQGAVQLSESVFVSYSDESREVQPRRVALDSLEDAGRKLGPQRSRSIIRGERSGNGTASLVDSILDQLLHRPLRELARGGARFRATLTAGSGRFAVSSEVLADLIGAVQQLVASQPTVLKLRAPIKVFGDIHGQYFDLLRLFGKYGAPIEEDHPSADAVTPGTGGSDIKGDIESVDYLFLGDIVDRGSHSLECLTLLLALKLKYPSQVHVIRGNHEDVNVNSLYGFGKELRSRLESEEASEIVFNKVNKMFEYLPVGAVIEDKILCLHGGIGGSINKLSDIEKIQRPLCISAVPSTEEDQIVTDLLWSDPTDNDDINGVMLNETRDPDGTGRIFKFGPDRVEQFLQNNSPLSMIIRAHECVMDGFERFARGKLLTVFSATDYCGHHKNAGALLFVRRDLTVVPKLIYPIREGQGEEVWDLTGASLRPPTPPRHYLERAVQ